MEFKQIEAFLNVVKYKGFSKAADATFLTQPTISAHISNLEKELGVSLISRQHRNVTLTASGKLFYPYAEKMMETRSEAVAQLTITKEHITGILDLQTSTIPGQYYLPKKMAQFKQSHKNVCFNIEQSDSKLVMENILNGQGELGFTGFQGNNQLVYEHIFTDEILLLTPNMGTFEHKEDGFISAEELKDLPFIVREQDSGTKLETERLLINGKSLYSEKNIVARMNSQESIKHAVAAGLGVTIVSGFSVNEEQLLADTKVFHIEGIEEKRNFYMVHRKSCHLSPVAETFRRWLLA